MPWGEVGCPDDLMGDEPCPIGIIQEENKIKNKRGLNNMANQNATPTTKLVTGKVRLSYANIWNPKADQQGVDKYSVSLIIPKSDKATIAKYNACIAAVKATGAAKWGGKIPPMLKTPLRDGDVERPDDEAYAGCYFMNANSNNKPGIVDANVNPILDQSEVYSGCYARVSVNFYAFNTAGSKGIGCGLNNIQKLADGESLGGAPSKAEDDFEALEDDGMLD